jgi:cytochrome c peroxidase
MPRIADINWSIKLYAVSGIYILGLLTVGVVGGYNIWRQSGTTVTVLHESQARADAAGSARIAIVNMGLAEAQMLSASDGDEKRAASISAIKASSHLDESIQQLQQVLAGNGKVAQLAQLLESIGPAKMQMIRAVRGNDDATARARLSQMQGSMSDISALADDLVQQAQDDLTAAVNEQQRRSKSTILVLGGVVGGGILVSLLMSWRFGRRLTVPLAALESSARALATGDLTIEVPNFGGDEIGRTAAAMGNMVVDLHAMVTNIERNGRSVTAHSGSVEDAANRLQAMFGKLQEAVEKIRSESALVLDSTSSTIRQLRDAATSAQATSESVAKNSGDVRKTAEDFRGFQGRMEHILEVSHELLSKVQTIGSIAETIKAVSIQANLVSLNASIQAAQAGVHGKTFAAVADEIRMLARNSGDATLEITSLTETIRSSIDETVTLLEQARSESNEKVNRLLAVAEETAASSVQSQQMHDHMHSMVGIVDRQESAVSGIASAVSGLFKISEDSKRQADGLHTLSAELNGAARELSKVVARFQLQPAANVSSDASSEEDTVNRNLRQRRLPIPQMLSVLILCSVMCRAQSPIDKKSFFVPATVPAPADNQVTKDRAGLGKMLFFDPRLSGSRWISCASCHNPAMGWSDGLPRALGTGMHPLKRSTPTIVNAAFNQVQMWDGRFPTLEEQALGPMTSTEEMDGNLEDILNRLRAIEGYREAFEKAYPGEGITKDTVTKAIASFERTVISKDAPFDAWVHGNPRAIDASAQRGYALFVGKANCAACHSGPSFSDSGFHNIGLKDDTDTGRYAKLPLKAMKGAFKTPTLRDVALTAPYMHNGCYRTLDEVVDHYNRGGDVHDNLDPSIKPLHLTDQEKKDLVRFLTTLTGKGPVVTLPTLPE